jgi:phosphotransferase system HPr (HPr) family protein
VVISDPMGLHIRTAAAIARLVRGAGARVTIARGDHRADGGELWELMTLLAPAGETLEIEAVGPDAPAVLEAIEPLLAGRFDDEPQPFA